MDKDKRIEQLAKDQARTLIKTLELIQALELEASDSDLIELKISLASWLKHVTPFQLKVSA